MCTKGTKERRESLMEDLTFYNDKINIFSIFYVLHLKLLNLVRYRIISIVMTKTVC